MIGCFLYSEPKLIDSRHRENPAQQAVMYLKLWECAHGWNETEKAALASFGHASILNFKVAIRGRVVQWTGEAGHPGFSSRDVEPCLYSKGAMMPMKKPRWLSEDDWRAHQQLTATFKAALLQRLRRALAEACTNLDADRHDPDLKNYHAARIRLLQCQIANLEGIASSHRTLHAPVIVNIDRPRKKRQQRATPLLVAPARL